MENFLQSMGNYFFPMVLSIYLIYRIDQFLTQLLKDQKSFQDMVMTAIRSINKNTHELRRDKTINGGKPLE